MNRVTLRQSPALVQIGAWQDGAPQGETRLVLRDLAHAQRFLQAHCTDAVAVAGLRRLLASDMYLLQRLDDQEVLHEIALRLANGRLLAFTTDTFRPAAGSASAPGATASRAPARPATQAPARRPAAPPVRRPAAPRAPAAEAEAPQPEPFDDVDQDAQAATLEEAARSGTPFCAICAAAARSRGEAQPA